MSLKIKCLIGTLVLLALGLMTSAAQAAVSESEAFTTMVRSMGTRTREMPGLQVTIPGESTLGEAQFVLEANPGESSGDRQTAAYVFVLKSDSVFHPNVPHPRRAAGPSGRYMTMIVDAEANRVTALALSPTMPNLAEIGTPVTVSLSNGAAETATTSCGPDRLLAAALARRHLKARHTRAAHALSQCLARHR